MVLLLGLAAACRTSGGPQGALKHPPVELPVVVVEDRFFLQTKTAAGAELRLFLDSAGGMFLTKQAVDRLRLPIKRLPAPANESGGDLDTVSFPQFYDARVPRPLLDPFPVLDDDQLLVRADGMFGAPWFAGRVFTFDYAGKRLWLRSPGDVPAVPAAHRLPFGLPRDGSGAASSPYGRIPMQVDGTAIDMLFDTGATVSLTDAAKQQLGGAATERATSFIIESVFDRWRKSHPDWRVIDAADKLGSAPMIEVPKVSIAGHDVGPVWFTRRPDKNFHEYMARMMDKPSDGALGGSALRHFQRVTVDWANATAVFEK